MTAMNTTAPFIEGLHHIDGRRRLGPPGHASVYFAEPFGNRLERVTLGCESAVLEGAPDVSKSGG
jgi:hypothetical protein